MSERPKTLLIVDADEAMRDRMAGAIAADLRVLRVATGEAALQVMDKEDVDLMLLDVRLPGIHGLDLLKIVGILKNGGYAGDLCVEDESLFKHPAEDRLSVLRREVEAVRKATGAA